MLKNKNKKQKRGMALANVVIMMTIVMMLCSLIMSVSVYNTNMAKLTTKNFEKKAAIDVIGADFLRLKGGMLEAYTSIAKVGSDGLPVVDSNGKPVYVYNYVTGESGVVSTDTVESKTRTISVKRKGAVYTMVVENRKTGEVVLTVVIDGSATRATSWVYGAKAKGYNG